MAGAFTKAWRILKSPRMVLDGMDDRKPSRPAYMPPDAPSPQIPDEPDNEDNPYEKLCPCGNGKKAKECCERENKLAAGNC